MLEKNEPRNKLQLTEMINSIYDRIADASFWGARDGINRNWKRFRQDAGSCKLSVEYGLGFTSLLWSGFDELRGRLDLKEDAKVKIHSSTTNTGKAIQNHLELPLTRWRWSLLMEQSWWEREIRAWSEVRAFAEIRRAWKRQCERIVIRITSGRKLCCIGYDVARSEPRFSGKPVIASMSDYARQEATTWPWRAIPLSLSHIRSRVLLVSSACCSMQVGCWITNWYHIRWCGNRWIRRYGYNQPSAYRCREERLANPYRRDLWNLTRKAAEGRHVTQDDIRQVASGRVWTGTQAKEKKLVDILGGYNDDWDCSERCQHRWLQSSALSETEPSSRSSWRVLKKNARVSAMKEELQAITSTINTGRKWKPVMVFRHGCHSN